MIERLIEFIRSIGMSERAFAEAMGISQQALNNYTRGANRLPVSLLERILKKYPQLSAEWLMRGRGNMLSAGEPSALRNVNELLNRDQPASEPLLKALLEALKQQQVRIDNLMNENRLIKEKAKMDDKNNNSSKTA